MELELDQKITFEETLKRYKSDLEKNPGSTFYSGLVKNTEEYIEELKLELDQKINQAIDKAIKDYFKIAKMERVSWKTLNKRHMNYGLCIYFIRNCNLGLNWDAIPNRPYYEENPLFGWICPEYCNHLKKLDVKEIGIKERLEFLLEHREVLPKYLEPVCIWKSFLRHCPLDFGRDCIKLIV